MKVIYVAGPYRAPTRDGVELNIQAAKRVGLLVAKLGASPIIPHMNTAHLDAVDPSIGDEYWLAATMELMRRCDAVVLVPGWENSEGTLAEIEEARRLGLKVFATTHAFHRWADGSQVTELEKAVSA